MRFPLLLLTFLAAALLPVSFAAAQAYEPGLLVHANGDTLRGEIENSAWSAPPTFIRFRLSAHQPEQWIQPHQLRAVVVGGRYFRYEGLPIDHAAETRPTYLTEGRSTNIRVDSLLAEVLLDGPATLLRVVQPGATHFLLQRAGLPMLDLSERQYLRLSPTKSMTVVDGNDYRSQLELFLGDCPAALRLLPNTPFNAKALLAVAQAYNEACAPSRQAGRRWLTEAPSHRRTAFQGGLLAGASLNHLTRRFDNRCVDCGLHPSAGLYAELLLPSRVTAIYGELSVATIRGQAQITPYSANPNSTPVYSAFNSTVGSATLGVRFFVPLARQQKLLFSLSYALNAVLDLPGQYANYDPESASRYGSAGFPGAGVGWRNGHLTVALNEQVYLDNLYHNAGLFGSGVNTRLGVAYRFGRNTDAARTTRPE